MDPNQKIIYTYTKGKGWVAGYESADELLLSYVFYNPAGYADAAQEWFTLRLEYALQVNARLRRQEMAGEVLRRP